MRRLGRAQMLLINWLRVRGVSFWGSRRSKFVYGLKVSDLDLRNGSDSMCIVLDLDGLSGGEDRGSYGMSGNLSLPPTGMGYPIL